MSNAYDGGSTSNSDLESRIRAVERLTNLFKTERTVYLVTTIVALLMLLGSALSLMIRDKAGAPELIPLFGSSGIITYTTGRLLFMWGEALKRLLPVAHELKEQM